ncbi:MAG: thioredoxin fold domain-containing protein [Saprospiraceae bacterium]|nr:thioredoxin fold domain-containing protein [Saprospiraceae bacterium]
MKQSILLLSSILILCSSASAKGIEFFHGTLQEAKELAGEQGKLIFVDAYTTWCGPCKRMSANVFPKDEVGDLYNTAFINLKLDMEKGEGRTFQSQYRVSAFPTLLFLDPEGEVVHKVVGGMDAANFVKLGKFAASKSNVTSNLDKEYEEGQRDPAFMVKYIEGLSKSKRPLLKVANEYLSTQSDFTTEENLAVIYFGMVEVDSRIFNLMVENRKMITKIYGQEALEEKIEIAAMNTVEKAIEFDNGDLLEEAVDKVKRYSPGKYKRFQYDARLKYYADTRKPDLYLRYARDYARQGSENKFQLANTILHHMRDQPKLMAQAESWALEAVDEQENEQNCFIAAQLLFLSNKYEKSKSYAEKALKYATETKSATTPHIQKLISACEQKIELK